MPKAKNTILKRVLQASAALIGISVTAAVVSWAISMPRSDLRGIWQTEGYGYVLDVGAFSIDIYETSAVSCLRSMQIPAHLGLI